MTSDLHTRSRLLPLGALLAADGASRMGNAVTIVAVPLLALHIVGSPWAVAAAGVAVVEHVQPGTVHGYLNRPNESAQARSDAADTIRRFTESIRSIVTS